MLYHILLAVAINTKIPSDFSEGTVYWDKLFFYIGRILGNGSLFITVYK